MKSLIASLKNFAALVGVGGLYLGVVLGYILGAALIFATPFVVIMIFAKLIFLGGF